MFFVFLLLILIGCNVQALSQESEHITTHSFEGYVFPGNHVFAGIGTNPNGCNLDFSQICKAEEILANHFSENKKDVLRYAELL